MKEARICNLLESAIAICASVMLLLVELAVRAVSVIASGTSTSDTNEASNNAVHGGVLNYRSGKFDDGTDAAGWYEKD
jgi:hypothetical protein